MTDWCTTTAMCWLKKDQTSGNQGGGFQIIDDVVTVGSRPFEVVVMMTLKRADYDGSLVFTHLSLLAQCYKMVNLWHLKKFS